MFTPVKDNAAQRGYSIAMQIRVLFFGMLKDALARESDLLQMPESCTVRQILEHYTLHAPQTKLVLQSLAVAVNQQYAQVSQALHDGDEVALLPPVSGGSGQDAINGSEDKFNSLTRIQDDPIHTESIVAQLKQGEDGAVVVFDGIVRNNTRGRQTHYLVYETYWEMALNQMHRLVRDAKQQYAIRDAAIVHRQGRLEVGETSVLIVVASAHRAQAFDACRWIIDTLKKTVPIWKKEYFQDGAVWADGEPFPAEIAVASRREK